jgi:hypothetical protein
MKVQILTGDNFSALYIDGVKRLEGHELYPYLVAGLFVGDENVEEVLEEDLDFDEVGDLWENGVGYPEEWPFED